MTTLKENLKKIKILVDQLSLRERVLILVSTIAIVYLSWRNIILENLASSKKQIAGSALNLQKQIFNLQGQLSEVSSSLNLDPIIRLQEKIDIIQKENEQLEKTLANMTEGLISPKEMTSLLKVILDKHQDLTVVRVENIQAVPIFGENIDGTEKTVKGSNIFQVYKHGIEFTVRGTYFQLLNFLEEAEQLPWKVFWEELEYSVNKYPIATIKIVIKTLSLDNTLFSTS